MTKYRTYNFGIAKSLGVHNLSSSMNTIIPDNLGILDGYEFKKTSRKNKPSIY